MGRGVTVVNTAVLLGAGVLQGVTGLIAGVLAPGAASLPPDIYRVIFATLAAVLACALLVYRRCPDMPPSAATDRRGRRPTLPNRSRTVKKVDVETLTDIEADLGEGPVWSAEDQTIYWIDVTQRKILRYGLTTRKAETFNVSGMPGSIALRKGGGIIAAYRTGPALIDLASGRETKLPSSIDFGKERFNDGKCDGRGRFFAGTMDKTMKDTIGGLYRIDADHSVTKVADDIRLSNGIGWSPDNRVMYHCDSRPGYVYAYDYDIDSGTPTNRRVHLDLTRRAIIRTAARWMRKASSGSPRSAPPMSAAMRRMAGAWAASRCRRRA